MSDALSDLKTIREKMELSQESLARRLGVSLYTVHRWEKGKTSPNALARRELALFLYGNNAIPLGRARKLSGLSKREFLSLLGERNIPRHYTGEDFEEDLKFVEQWSL